MGNGKPAILILCLVILMVGGVFLVPVVTGAQDQVSTATPIDFNQYADVYATLIPVGPDALQSIPTPDQPLSLEHYLDHENVAVMLPKAQDCASRVATTGEDCTSIQGQSYAVMRDVYPRQLIRVSGDNTHIITTNCPGDTALLDKVSVEKNIPMEERSLADKVVNELGGIGCLMTPVVNQYTGAFYNDNLYLNKENHVVRIGIVVPSGGDITTFIPKWGTEWTAESVGFIVSLAMERVTVAPQTVDRFAPGPTAVPNGAGSFADMVASMGYDPAALSTEDFFAILRTFVGMGLDISNVYLAEETGGVLTERLRGVYARYLVPAYWDLRNYDPATPG